MFLSDTRRLIVRHSYSKFLFSKVVSRERVRAIRDLAPSDPNRNPKWRAIVATTLFCSVWTTILHPNILPRLPRYRRHREFLLNMANSISISDLQTKNKKFHVNTHKQIKHLKKNGRIISSVLINFKNIKRKFKFTPSFISVLQTNIVGRAHNHCVTKLFKKITTELQHVIWVSVFINKLINSFQII